MVATLGSEPQVITLSVEVMVRNMGLLLDKLIVIHTSTANPTIDLAVRKLKEELVETKALLGREIEVLFEPVMMGGALVEDFKSEEDIMALMGTMYKVMVDLKRKAYQVHLLISGGRKVMGNVGVVLAQLLMEEGDKVWYLISDDRVLFSKSFHLGGTETGEVRLISVPIVHWYTLPSALRGLLIYDDPKAALAKQEEIRKNEYKSKVERFLKNLTPAEREVVSLMAKGLSSKQIAAKLHKSDSTVCNQLKSVYQKYRDLFGVDDSISVRSRIIIDLAQVLEQEERLRTT